MKALIVASVASMIDQFNMTNIQLLQELGYEVHVACNFAHPGTITKEKALLLEERLKSLNVHFFQIDFSRNVLNLLGHLMAMHQLKRILKSNKYYLIHCHSPIGGLLTRLLANKYRKKTGTKVIYTAHGFHFYKGAPIKNWIIYYPIEKICSKKTDVLITINKEDFKLARKKMRAKIIKYIPGVGADTSKFSSILVDKNKKRDELGLPRDAYVILSVGELNRNKNHQVIIKAIAKINNPNIHYVIAGVGSWKKRLEKMAVRLGVKLHLLGYRKDVAELLKISDLFVHPSYREGLPVSLMEAIASGCIIIASQIRGNKDLLPIENCFNPYSVSDAVRALINVSNNRCGYVSPKVFDYSVINHEMKIIYNTGN